MSEPTGILVADPWRGASHQNMIAALTGPLQAGARETEIAIAADGTATIAWSAYEPVLLVSPRTSLGNLKIRVDATMVAGQVLAPVVFAPHTEASTYLPLYLPAVDPSSRTAAPFSVKMRMSEIDIDGVVTKLEGGEAEQRLTCQLAEGVLARIIYLLGAEKGRLRRQARRLSAIRSLDAASNASLDRLGAELDVPRFAEQLVVQDGAVVPVQRIEPDAEYRSRLRIYRRWCQPARTRLLEQLDQDRLRPQLTGSEDRTYEVNDRGERLALAVRIIGVGDATDRDRLLEHVRLVHLLWPANNPYANTVHARRQLPPLRRQSDALLRAEMRRLFTFEEGPGAAVAGRLAAAVVRAARCREALGDTEPWVCSRTHDPEGGSRYELGLGLDLQPLAASHLNELARAHAERAPIPDREVEDLLRGMTPRLAADDPDGRWLLEPCGMATVHRVNSKRLFVSHLPMDGMVIDGPQVIQVGQSVEYAGLYHARLDPGPHVLLTDGLASASTAWIAAGYEPWTLLSRTAARARLASAPRQPAGAPALTVLDDAGLPAVTDPTSVVARLELVPSELFVTVQLAAELSESIVNGASNAAARLRELVGLLRVERLVAVLPIVTGATEVVLLIAVEGLPEAGRNLMQRRVIGTRWSTEPITTAGVAVARTGPRVRVTADEAGVTALIALGIARRGGISPYEIQVTLPDGARLDFGQYEYLMNLLDLAHPLGVAVNTAKIRQFHVDASRAGQAVPLSASLSRSYRMFRAHRGRIAGDVIGGAIRGLQIGVHSTIGVDTLLAPDDSP